MCDFRVLLCPIRFVSFLDGSAMGACLRLLDGAEVKFERLCVSSENSQSGVARALVFGWRSVVSLRWTALFVLRRRGVVSHGRIVVFVLGWRGMVFGWVLVFDFLDNRINAILRWRSLLYWWSIFRDPINFGIFITVLVFALVMAFAFALVARCARARCASLLGGPGLLIPFMRMHVFSTSVRLRLGVLRLVRSDMLETR